MIKNTTVETYYITTFSYNAGLLGADHRSNTLEEARAFEEDYKNNFEDCDKYFRTLKVTRTTTKKLFRKLLVESTCEEVNSWCEE